MESSEIYACFFMHNSSITNKIWTGPNVSNINIIQKNEMHFMPIALPIFYKFYKLSDVKHVWHIWWSVWYRKYLGSCSVDTWFTSWPRTTILVKFFCSFSLFPWTRKDMTSSSILWFNLPDRVISILLQCCKKALHFAQYN